MRILRGLLPAIVLAAIAVPAAATVISGSIVGGSVVDTGTFIKLTVPLANPLGPPNSVGDNTFNLPNLYAFDESQNVVLANSLTADLVPSGSLTLPNGLVVASHYVFFDPDQRSTVDGYVNFDSNIVAVFTSRITLNASDFLANTGVNYLSPNARGIESASQGDLVSISGAQQVHIQLTAGNPGDYIRVLTAFSPAAVAVPEPESLVLMLAGLIGAGVAATRRRSRPVERRQVGSTR